MGTALSLSTLTRNRSSRSNFTSSLHYHPHHHHHHHQDRQTSSGGFLSNIHPLRALSPPLASTTTFHRRQFGSPSSPAASAGNHCTKHKPKFSITGSDSWGSLPFQHSDRRDLLGEITLGRCADLSKSWKKKAF